MNRFDRDGCGSIAVPTVNPFVRGARRGANPLRIGVGDALPKTLELRPDPCQGHGERLGRYAGALPFVLSTPFFLAPIARVAAPVASGVTHVSVRRHHEGHARTTVFPVTPFTFPVAPRGGEVAEQRHFDRDASVVNSPVPAVAFPVSSRSREMRLRR